ncbi:MAG: hypothetical protein ACN2B6_01740 [Rickettsiales bacterium]
MNDEVNKQPEENAAVVEPETQTTGSPSAKDTPAETSASPAVDTPATTTTSEENKPSFEDAPQSPKGPSGLSSFLSGAGDLFAKNKVGAITALVGAVIGSFITGGFGAVLLGSLGLLLGGALGDKGGFLRQTFSQFGITSEGNKDRDLNPKEGVNTKNLLGFHWEDVPGVRGNAEVRETYKELDSKYQAVDNNAYTNASFAYNRLHNRLGEFGGEPTPVTDEWGETRDRYFLNNEKNVNALRQAIDKRIGEIDKDMHDNQPLIGSRYAQFDNPVSRALSGGLITWIFPSTHIAHGDDERRSNYETNKLDRRQLILAEKELKKYVNQRAPIDEARMVELAEAERQRALELNISGGLTQDSDPNPGNTMAQKDPDRNRPNTSRDNGITG